MIITRNTVKRLLGATGIALLRRIEEAGFELNQDEGCLYLVESKPVEDPLVKIVSDQADTMYPWTWGRELRRAVQVAEDLEIRLCSGRVEEARIRARRERTRGRG